MRLRLNLCTSNSELSCQTIVSTQVPTIAIDVIYKEHKNIYAAAIKNCVKCLQIIYVHCGKKL